ncbi:MAG: hypothetical protein J4F48_02635 [Nitrospinae bacterium]|nr:hypothetical protein [Nitrospinota bacterium]
MREKTIGKAFSPLAEATDFSPPPAHIECLFLGLQGWRNIVVSIRFVKEKT